jgi:hypothetical protein
VFSSPLFLFLVLPVVLAGYWLVPGIRRRNLWYPLLGPSFARVLYLHRYSWDAALIERERPHAVVDQIAERHLNQGDPRDLRERDALSR